VKSIITFEVKVTQCLLCWKHIKVIVWVHLIHVMKCRTATTGCRLSKPAFP